MTNTRLHKSLADAYSANDDTVQSWFGGPWESTDALADWVNHIDPKQHTWDRPQLSSIALQAVADYSSPSHNNAHAIKNATALAQDNTWVVVTGQQPAIGGGPLYTLVKTAHAISTCRRLQKKGMRVVPVFWCASEDHDEGEANHADFLRTDGKTARYTQALTIPGASTRYQPAKNWWQDIHSFCQEEYGRNLGTDFLEKFQPLENEGMGAWLCRLMAALFAEDGLICLEAWRLRPLWSSALPTILSEWPRSPLARRREQVTNAGFADALGPLLQAPLFLDQPHKRTPLSHEAAQQLVSQQHNVNQANQNISTGAALRPVVQQLALPALAYIAGPGEITYHALIGPLYKTLGAPMPRLVPRLSAYLISSRLERHLSSWGVKPEDTWGEMPSPKLRSQAPNIKKGLDAIELGIQTLETATSADDRDMTQRLDTSLIKLKREYERLQKSLERGERRHRKLAPFSSLLNQIFPKNKPQDRIMSMYQALYNFGPGLAHVLIHAATQNIAGAHVTIKMGSTNAETALFQKNQ